MKRFKFLAIAFALFAVLAAAPAQAALQDMWANVYKWSGGVNSDGSLQLTELTSGVQFQVLAHDSTTAETLYYYNGSTSLTNTPVSTTSFASASICNKRVAFRVDPTDSTDDRYVDLLVNDTVGGFTLFYPHFDKYVHTLVIDERPNVMHHGAVYFNGTTTTETSTGLYFKPKWFIADVRVEVVGISSSQTLDVGIKNVDPDGFRKGVSLATAGFVADTAVYTSISTLGYTPASTYGALLYTAVTGTAYAGGETGGRSYLGYVCTSSVTAGNFLTYKNSGSTAYGYIHYWFTPLGF